MSHFTSSEVKLQFICNKIARRFPVRRAFLTEVNFELEQKHSGGKMETLKFVPKDIITHMTAEKNKPDFSATQTMLYFVHTNTHSMEVCSSGTSTFRTVHVAVMNTEQTNTEVKSILKQGNLLTYQFFHCLLQVSNYVNDQ